MISEKMPVYGYKSPEHIFFFVNRRCENMIRIALCDDNKEDMLQLHQKIIEWYRKIVKSKCFYNGVQ